VCLCLKLPFRWVTLKQWIHEKVDSWPSVTLPGNYYIQVWLNKAADPLFTLVNNWIIQKYRDFMLAFNWLDIVDSLPSPADISHSDFILWKLPSVDKHWLFIGKEKRFVLTRSEGCEKETSYRLKRNKISAPWQQWCYWKWLVP